MATIISYGYINFYEHGRDAWVTDWTSERIDIEFEGGYSMFEGSGFAWNEATEQWSGTVNYYAEYDLYGDLTFGIGDLAEPASLFQLDFFTTFNTILDGDDVIALLGASDDVVFAGGGDDIIFSFRGSKHIDGGDGIDTVVYEFAAPGYSVTRDAGAIYVDGAGSNDVLISVERIGFENGVLAFDDNAAQMYRLYQAAFDRTPDTAGLSYWVLQADSGIALVDAAHGFIGSDEFRGIYGAAPSDSEIIDLLYLNVLDRHADQAGFDYWGGQLASGLSRAELLVHFAESPENVVNTAPAIVDGVWLA